MYIFQSVRVQFALSWQKNIFSTHGRKNARKESGNCDIVFSGCNLGVAAYFFADRELSDVMESLGYSTEFIDVSC